jgi:hypothetical protein
VACLREAGETQFFDDIKADRSYERTNCLVSELDLSSIILHFYSQDDGDDEFHTLRSTRRNKIATLQYRTYARYAAV